MAAPRTLSRRALVAGAAMSALAGPAVAAPNPDAALLDLGRRFTAAAARCDAANDATDAAWDVYVAPEPPEALFRRPSDTFSTYGLTRREGRRWYGGEIDSLRNHGITSEIARRDEIVAAHAAWQADIGTARDVAGLTAAEAERSAASAATRDLTDAIVAAPAATLAGVMVKARAAGWSYGGLDGIAHEIGEEAAGTGETMMLALLRDLLTLASSGALPAA